MTPLCTLLKSGSDVLVQTFTVLVYRPSFLGYMPIYIMIEETTKNPDQIVQTRNLNSGSPEYKSSVYHRIASRGILRYDMMKDG
ncbi:hypothetical protein ANN_11416 [Periplaneta americana]|uniref:Uncharacterized protein n=1 Tax=Periplaneta americana TaxID=6978 RepID=A0ABQ8T6P4_PERAM|nr:hypothetical protein ANN_11416 [Periplaneta americana]